ncbi:MAG: 50S ribosomal protein L5 [Bacteroidota bacterium]
MAKEIKEKPKKESKSKQEVSNVKEEKIIPRLRTLYKENVINSLLQRFGYKTVMQVPRIEKVTVNVGIGKAMQVDAKIIEIVTKELEQIVGQKTVITKAKKSISNFKLREGLPVGVRVTLRGDRMYEFVDRFISVAVPRIRDFRGFSDKSFDGRGNYTLGIKEQVIFPEIDTDKVTKLFGMDITFVTTAPNDAEAYELLKGIGMPFVKRDNVATK